MLLLVFRDPSWPYKDVTAKHRVGVQQEVALEVAKNYFNNYLVQKKSSGSSVKKYDLSEISR